jgi:hypothetical protein
VSQMMDQQRSFAVDDLPRLKLLQSHFCGNTLGAIVILSGQSRPFPSHRLGVSYSRCTGSAIGGSGRWAVGMISDTARCV